MFPRLIRHKLSLEITGGYATHLLSQGSYYTTDVDIVVCSQTDTISDMKKLIKEEISHSIPKNFILSEDQTWYPQNEAGKLLSDEKKNDGTIPLKIISRNRVIAEFTFVTGCKIGAKEGMVYQSGFHIQTTEELISNLLEATKGFEEKLSRRNETRESIYPKKILNWYLQLTELYLIFNEKFRQNMGSVKEKLIIALFNHPTTPHGTSGAGWIQTDKSESNLQADKSESHQAINKQIELMEIHKKKNKTKDEIEAERQQQLQIDFPPPQLGNKKKGGRRRNGQKKKRLKTRKRRKKKTKRRRTYRKKTKRRR